jgi:hypothetical protein
MSLAPLLHFMVNHDQAEMVESPDGWAGKRYSKAVHRARAAAYAPAVPLARRRWPPRLRQKHSRTLSAQHELHFEMICRATCTELASGRLDCPLRGAGRGLRNSAPPALRARATLRRCSCRAAPRRLLHSFSPPPQLPQQDPRLSQCELSQLFTCARQSQASMAQAAAPLWLALIQERLAERDVREGALNEVIASCEQASPAPDTASCSSALQTSASRSTSWPRARRRAARQLGRPWRRRLQRLLLLMRRPRSVRLVLSAMQSESQISIDSQSPLTLRAARLRSAPSSLRCTRRSRPMPSGC